MQIKMLSLIRTLDGRYLMKRSVFIIAGLLAGFFSQSQNPGYSLRASNAISYSQLQQGFKAPPHEARLRCYWWWLNSMATKESITRDLEQMKAKGYGGASIVDA